MGASHSRENQRIYQSSTHAELRGVFHGPITVVDGGPKKRTAILEWISTVPYTNHHKRISDDRLEGTGEWILKKEKYCTWGESTDSMLLLLRGIPGAGKTYIASQVIDWFLSNGPAESKLVYFYCNRAEESRRDPESILRTLIQQLAQTPSKDELLSPVLNIYNEREKEGQLSSRLTLKECQVLLVQLMAVYPLTTICIDALDEVDHELRLGLLEALKYVVERSNTLVKIFATTRMDTDILLQFEIFPRIEMESDDNIDDINRFVKDKVQRAIERKQLLDGNVANALKDEICQVLCERSKGMFLLAALQITLLCDMVTPDDVRDSLKDLPETLRDAYDEIYNRILGQKGSAPRLALNAFRWVRCSYEPLQSEVLLDAVTVEVVGSGEFSRKGTGVSATGLLKVCQNLLILDERLNVFRFAHLSVEEYLDAQLLEVDSHTEIAKICLSLVCSLRSWVDYDTTLETWEGEYDDRHLLLYSAVFWPWHLKRCKESCEILTALWEAFVSEDTFQHWIDYHCQCVQTEGSEDTFWLRSESLQREGRDRFSTVCVFGLGRKLANISESQSGWIACTSKNPTTSISESVQRTCVERLLLCASTFGDLDIAQRLLDAGASVLVADDKGSTPLHRAAKNGQEELAELLVVRGADIKAVNNSGSTPLYRAVKNGHAKLAQLLVDRGADVAATNKNGLTPLHRAAKHAHGNLAQLLVDRGADVSARESDGWTPLHVASLNGNQAVARLLVDRGADVLAAAGEKMTALHFTAYEGHETLARLLLDRGADVSAANGDGNTPLHAAAYGGHEVLARLLLDRGADVSVTNRNRSTPLHLAAHNGHEVLARLLLDRGADVSATDSNGDTALHATAHEGQQTLARLFLDRGAKVSAVKDDGETPLHLAAHNGHEAFARLLLERGADVTAADSNGWAPLHDAAFNGHVALAQLLLGGGADVSAAKSDGRTPLHLAAHDGHEAFARLLLERGANVTAADSNGWAPLHDAAFNGHVALAQLLLEGGADVLAAQGDGGTPLHLAAGNGHEACARLLLGRGASVTATNNNGCAPLHDAAFNGHVALAQLLLEGGAEVSVAKSNGRTPLYFAACNGHEACARLLLDRGAKATAADSNGCAPLHSAALNGHEAVAQLLLERGADISAAKSNGRTSLHLAARKGLEAFARLLLDQGAEVTAADSNGWDPCGRRCGRRPGGGRIGGRSETSWRTGGAAERYSTSLHLRMWGGGFCPRRTTW